MKKLWHTGIAALWLVLLTIHANFKLATPVCRIAQDEKGVPQKMAPCGGSMADGGTWSDHGVIVENPQQSGYSTQPFRFHQLLQ